MLFVSGGALLFLLGIIGFLSVQRTQLQGDLNDEIAANEQLFSHSGKMCAVYSITEAAELLESEVNVDAASYPSGFASALEQSEFLPRIDNCRYLGTTNNTRYVYFFSQVYDQIPDAQSDFSLQKQLILDAEEIDPKQFGVDEAFYYGGAVFVRRGSAVFSVSVNKPEIASKDQKDFTLKLFDSVYKQAFSLL
jgi:hypothetical protein